MLHSPRTRGLSLRTQFYDTMDNQAMSATITARVHSNTCTNNLFSPNFGLPTVFVDPRRAMLSVRPNLGR
jgi:hypothetical protein